MPRFLSTTGESVIGLAICSRCQTKRRFSELQQDGNIQGFYVCRPTIRRGCWDRYDPFREPAPPPDKLTLPFVRPDTELTVPTAEQAPLEPTVPPANEPTE